MNLIKYINQPFPKAESKWKVIISISLFVALFLIVFQPFDINFYRDSNKHLVLSGYGFVTFFILIFDMIILENIFKEFYAEQNWKIWKEFISLIIVIFTIGLGNAIYTSIVFGFYFKVGLSFFIQFQLITLVVGIIPITVLIITKQKYLLRKHINSANDVNRSLDEEKIETTQNKHIRFYTNNEKDLIEFDVNDFHFIESSGNYIELYLTDNNNIIRKTFRSTLKRSLDYFTNTPEIIQCHRAFIVNTNKIANAKGNSQGLRLNLENCDLEVPVSRGFVSSVRKILN